MALAKTQKYHKENYTSCAGGRHNMSLPTCDLDLWPFDLNMVSEACVTWATSELILVFLGLSVLELAPMYATNRRQTASSLNAPAWGGG